MRREERLEAMSAADEARLIALADEVLATLPVEVVRGPTVGLLMARAEEPMERLAFNLVEVTVTEAEVVAGGERGYGLVLGRAPERALAGAVLDVALEVGHDLAPRIDALLQEALAVERAGWERRWQEVAPTRVRFEEAL